MFSIERRNEILDLLKTNKSVVVSELAKKFFVSEATIRRDLSKIDKQKIIKRTYGGAILLDALSQPLPLHFRERENSSSKNIIGRLASEYVDDFDTIIIDSSSTTMTMVNHLINKNQITIITNGIKTASLIGQTLSCNFLCTGGASYDKTLSLVGNNAEAFMSSYNVNKLFFSCRSISQNGHVSNSSIEESSLKRVMVEHSEKIYLLADHAKLGPNALSSICTLKDIDYFITDRKPPNNWLQIFDKFQVELIYPDSI